MSGVQNTGNADSRGDHPATDTVAVNMRRLRRQRGWTQDELGQRLGGWSKAVVSAAEKTSAESARPRMFSIDEVVRLAEVLEVSIVGLVTPVPPCEYCGDAPARGMKCMACGVSDRAFTMDAPVSEEKE